jgi:sec-independent protein translocase protein TatA
MAEVLQSAGRLLGDASVEATRMPARSAPMFGRLGLPELVIILVIIILIFGANRLPDIGRGIGKGIKNFKEATNKSANDDNA